MGSISSEITRLETAKSKIETAIELCGVNVPDTEKIDTYASYISAIPSAVFSTLNADSVGGVDQFIRSIEQTNGIINATAGGLVSASGSGLVPQVISSNENTVGKNYYVLASSTGSNTPSWYKLPTNSFADTTYSVFTGATALENGTSGLVPLPSKNNYTLFLCGDGTWKTPEYLTFYDTRATETQPSDYQSKFKFVGIKNATAVGLTTALVGTYVSLIGWKGWTDNTGPFSWELASCNKHRLLVRDGQGKNSDGSGNETWNSWKTLAYISDIFPSNLVTIETNYTKASSIASIVSSDSLSTALGKLEYKTDFIYNDLIGGTDNADVIDKWSEIKDFIAEVGKSTDITEEFVTRKTAQLITGIKTFTNSITATSFITKDGTSSLFVKGDGSLDSTNYATTANLNAYLQLSGGEMTGSIIMPANKNEGIFPKTTDYGLIGSSSKKFSQMFATTINCSALKSGSIYNGTTIYANEKEVLHADDSYVEFAKGFTDVIAWHNGSKHIFKVGDKEALLIDYDGNIGIGNVGGSPAYMLHIGGGEVMADGYNAWSTGFKKNGCTDNQILLAGGGHKNLTDLFTSLSSDTNNAISITIGGVTKTIEASTLKTSIGLNTTNYPGLNKTGTITGVTAGNGLTGGGTSSSVTLNVGAGTGISVAANTVGISTTYQTYISNGNTAYGWGNHADAGYVTSSGVTSVGTGVGLTGGTITGTGTLKCNLNSETSLGTLGTTSKLYAVGVDASGKLCVNVAWANTQVTNEATTNSTYYLCGSTDSANVTGTLLKRSDVYVNSSGYLYANAFYQNSDIQLKHNVLPLLDNLLNYIYNIKEVSFNWNSDGTESFGYIAQDYAKISKTFVSEKEDGTLTLNYTGVLVAQIAALKLKIQELENKISNM